MTLSLRARLFVGVTALAVAIGLVAGALAFRWAFHEAIEFQDATLEQVGALAVRDRLRGNATALTPAVEFEDQLVVEELPGLGASPAEPAPRFALPSDLPDGLHVVPQASGDWRVLIRTRADGSRVAIAQPTATRDEVANDSALRSVLPLAVLLPCLMLLVGVVIRVSFAPVTRLARRLDTAAADIAIDRPIGVLGDLPTDDLPGEILPFVVSINRLLAGTRAQMAQQQRFVADAAHELRTPITALSLQAQNLERAALEPDDARRLAALRAGIGRVARLLEQLLALARSEAAAAHARLPRRLDQVVSDVVAECLPLAEPADIDLGFSRIEPAWVWVETAALHALVRNLVENALRHSPEGGRIDVAVTDAGGQAVLVIEDQGPGIPEAERAHVFKPFVRGDGARGEGSGLGLSIVQRIVEAHAGTIELDDAGGRAGSGLRVTVRLPAADVSRAGQPELARQSYPGVPA